ncbi:hypothetical protein GSI_14876 [Ganoderma sinense ZZ0214-1]|uniref:F-box domain-containing protein n=1 Tax=Ganoderma sinense ZZ0214-1 TaxID=1077348 RepID=A0A2G8RPY5_9APHY|nr:hypothetical protein GSI_14876 [Ganoderma sinense ZZ0214-1]
MHLSPAERHLFRVEPTLEVIQAAEATIRTHEGYIEALEDRIGGLLAQVRDLRYDQAKHRAAIERSRGLITLARRLPDELLIKIFGHLVADGWTRAPVVISHVCSSWRRAAHAPTVWSHVYVNCDDANVYERTKFWLRMAEGADVHVTVTASWRIPHWQIKQLMGMLVERSAQWRSLKVETDSLRHAELIFQECTLPLPQLRTIVVKTNAADSADAGVSDLQILAEQFTSEHAPRLARVEYASAVVPAAPTFPTHIASLALEIHESPVHRPLSAASLMDALEPLTSLHTLSLTMPLLYDHTFVPSPVPERTITLPVLSTLVCYGPTDLNELLPHLHTPALRALHLRSLEDLGYRQQPIAPSLLSFLALPGSEDGAPPLEVLELHDIDLAPDAFAAVFGALSGSLRELRLHESSISDATVRLLQGPGGLCPRLARLDLRWCGMLQGRALVDLVRSRASADADAEGSGSPARIEEVSVVNCAFVREEDVLDLARMTVCRIVMRDGDDYCRVRGLQSHALYWPLHISKPAGRCQANGNITVVASILYTLSRAARPSKRVRTDDGLNAKLEPSLDDDLTSDEEFWLEDGNVVLVAGNRAFKIYRGLLAI